MNGLKEKHNIGACANAPAALKLQVPQAEARVKHLSITSSASRIPKEIRCYIPKTQSFVLYCFISWNIFESSLS